jgi:hypothetical protein
VAEKQVLRNNKPQDIEDEHGPGYDNDVPADSWLRSDGEKKPFYDKGNAWRTQKRGN